MAKIMLVEDDANLQSIYGDRLTAEGHSIISAGDGEEALSMAIREKPDLIISDVMMPKISGFDMLDILRTTPETKDVKIIMMTALSQAEDKERADKLGADKYLVKSQVTLDDVARTVNEVIKEDKAAATQTEGVGSSPAPVAAPAPSAAPAPTEPAAINPLASIAPPVDPSAPATTLPSEPNVTSPMPAPFDKSPESTPAVPPTPDQTAVTAAVAADETSAQDEQKDTQAAQDEVASKIDEFLAKNLPDTPTHDPAAAPADTQSVTEPTVMSQSADEAPAADDLPADTTAPVIPEPKIEGAEDEGNTPDTESEQSTPTPVSSPGNEPILGSSAGDRKVVEPSVPDASEPPKTNIMDLYHQELAKESETTPQPEAAAPTAPPVPAPEAPVADEVPAPMNDVVPAPPVASETAIPSAPPAPQAPADQSTEPKDDHDAIAL